MNVNHKLKLRREPGTVRYENYAKSGRVEQQSLIQITSNSKANYNTPS